MKIAVIVVITGLATVANAEVHFGGGGAIPDPIPFGGGPGVFSSSIVVSGDTDFPITSVVVSLQGLQHTWTGDLIATVTSPSGTEHTLFARVGRFATGVGDSSDLNGEYTFADGGADLWAAAAGVFGSVVIAPGTYHTTGSDSAAATSMNAAFAGQNGNGTWTLTIIDNARNNTGSLGGWQLTIVPAPGASAVLGLGGLLVSRRRR